MLGGGYFDIHHTGVIWHMVLYGLVPRNTLFWHYRCNYFPSLLQPLVFFSFIQVKMLDIYYKAYYFSSNNKHNLA